MTFRQLPLVCRCGRAPSALQTVGLTAQHELVVHWICDRCRQGVYVVKTLSDCWRECPDTSGLPETVPCNTGDFRPEDLAFLRSIRVRLPDGER